MILRTVPVEAQRARARRAPMERPHAPAGDVDDLDLDAPRLGHREHEAPRRATKGWATRPRIEGEAA